jgi:DMSO/TMAO reductase YedYZ heme-binding membrane subunit
MSLGTRKLVVLILVASVFVLANVWLVVRWLEEKGVIDFAKHIRHEFLTGTAVTIIVVLLILLVRPGGNRAGLFRRCPVCDHTIVGRGNYCAGCGSKV